MSGRVPPHVRDFRDARRTSSPTLTWLLAAVAVVGCAPCEPARDANRGAEASRSVAGARVRRGPVAPTTPDGVEPPRDQADTGAAREPAQGQGTLRDAPASLRAAYVASRQAEGAGNASYGFRVEQGRASAAHPRQQLRASHDGRALELRTPHASGSLSAAALRCDGRRLPLPAGRVSAQANRAEMDRSPGAARVDEWYVNGPLGLEQGFEVTAGCEATMAVEVATTGFTAIAVDGVVRLVSGPEQTGVRYSDLYVTDASGRELPSRFVVEGGKVLLHVDTAGATWPVNVDPLIWVETARINPAPTGSGAANDTFGSSLGLDGDTAVIGAPGDDLGGAVNQGSAYVFVRTGSTWTEQAMLVAPDGVAQDGFGESVSVSGDTVVVGANLADVAGQIDQGSAYVFVRSGTTWTQQTKLVATDGAAGDQFGASASVRGDTVVIGANFDDVGVNASQGSAYVFVRSGTAWTEQSKLVASDGAANDQFAGAVALDVDTVVVGVHRDLVGANLLQGSAYVFVRAGATWTQQAKLVATDGIANEHFGRSVSVHGDTAVVGANEGDVGANVNQGAAYVFVRSGTLWTEQAKLVASDGVAGQQFGVAVSVEADTAVVGAPLIASAAYVYVRSGTVWTEQAKLTAVGTSVLDRFASTVALSGETALFGLPNRDIAGEFDRGTVRSFVRGGTMWTQEAEFNTLAGASGDSFGASVALDGDTAVVGMPGDEVGSNANQGAAYVFVLAGSTWTLQARLTASDGAGGDAFGNAVDVEGDTAVIGAHLDDIAGMNRAGSAYVFVRTGTVWAQQAKLVASNAGTTDVFGSSVALSGDTALIGAPGADVPSFGMNAGIAYVFVRSGTTWSEQAQLVALDGSSVDEAGRSVALQGDTAVVGAIGVDLSGGQKDYGAAYVFVRAGTTWTQQQKLMASDGAATDELGSSLALDLDTLVVGAHWADVGGRADQGAAYVFVRSGSIWTEQGKLVASDGAAGDELGQSIALTGDSVIVGAPLDDVATQSDQGSAYVFTRSGSSWTETAQLRSVDGIANDQFGTGVALDATRALVGAPLVEGSGSFGNPDDGRAYVFDLVDDSCAPGTWSTDGSRTAGCQACAMGTYAAGSGSTGCTAWTTCVLGEYASVVGSATMDRVCATCLNGGANYTCGPLQYRDGTACQGSGTADTQTCAAVTVCTATEFEVSPPTGTSDRVCQALTVCGAGYQETMAPTATSDRQCGDIDECATANGGCAGTCTNLPGSFACSCSTPTGVCSPIGTGCSDGTECGSSFCVDGVCCDAACGGGGSDCQACAAALTGGTDGVCTVFASGSVCRASAGACDVAETCDGVETACPADSVAPPSTVCRAAAGACDVAEACDGATPACPIDDFVGTGTTCRPAVSACDVAEICSGASAACPPDAFAPATTACGGASTACVSAGACAGTSAACVATVMPDGSPCDDGSLCSTADRCVAGACVGDPAAAGQPCRPSRGACDVAESCDGVTAACPGDAVEYAGKWCRPAVGPCDATEMCDGRTVDCPADGMAPSTTLCRPAAGPCDAVETCTGSSPTCPVDAFLPATVQCGEPPNDCYDPGFCNGVSAVCAAVQRPNGSPCDDGSACSAGEACAAGECVGGTPAAVGTVCRAARGPCDVEETCDGSTTECAADELLDGTVCRPSTGSCDLAEHCNGISPRCPTADIRLPAGFPCRGVGGPCDVGEACDGIGASCPEDGLQTSGVVCFPASNVCNPSDVCDGTAASCPQRISTDGSPCDDGLTCTLTSTCSNGVCQAATTLDCSDSDACTTDLCVEPAGCTHATVPACLADVGMPEIGTPDADTTLDAGMPPVAQTGCSCRVVASERASDGWVGSVLCVFAALARWRVRRRGLRDRRPR